MAIGRLCHRHSVIVLLRITFRLLADLAGLVSFFKERCHQVQVRRCYDTGITDVAVPAL